GFPSESYEFVYATKGDAKFAEELHGMLAQHKIKTTLVDRGFDNCTFVPLMLTRPQADIPVVTRSINGKLSTSAHFALGHALAPLREQGTLIVCSGQATHEVARLGAYDRETADSSAARGGCAAVGERTKRTRSTPSRRALHLLVIAAAAGMDADTSEAAKLFGDWEGNHLSYATYARGVAGAGPSSSTVASA
ncbi:hypothetical protein PybrP1_004053, partial [[Pythium] brassicae (nom. inval.)]